jgi:proteasome lid subunit RPN8/RPN11
VQEVACNGACENLVVLVISHKAYSELRRHGEAEYSEESCGVLVGRIEESKRVAMSAILCKNARRDSPRDRYAIDPKDLIRILRKAREQGLDIVGFYHSHPDHPAQWSSTDLAEAHWIGCSYVITSVMNGHATETRSFLLTGSADEKEKEFVEEQIVQQDAVDETAIEKPHPLR